MRSKIIFTITFSIFGLLLVALPTGGGAETVAPEPGTRPTNLEGPAHEGTPPSPLQEFKPQMDATFVYRRAGRPDPFVPFLDLLITDDDEELEELQRFEPGQLHLTAIVITPTELIAMVADATGTGHIVRAGDAIGRAGRVQEITAGRVIIQQELLSPTGETEYRTIEMVLKNDNEE